MEAASPRKKQTIHQIIYTMSPLVRTVQPVIVPRPGHSGAWPLVLQGQPMERYGTRLLAQPLDLIEPRASTACGIVGTTA